MAHNTTVVMTTSVTIGNTRELAMSHKYILCCNGEAKGHRTSFALQLTDMEKNLRTLALRPLMRTRALPEAA